MRKLVFAVVSVAMVGFCGTLKAEPLVPSRATIYSLPEDFEGTAMDKTDGNPVVMDGKAVWELDQVWPDNPLAATNYVPFLWDGKQWSAKENSQGGQPAVNVGEQLVTLGVRGPWSGNAGAKIAALSFIAPADGIYSITGEAKSEVWTGEGGLVLRVIRLSKATGQGTDLASLPMPRKGTIDLGSKLALYAPVIKLAAGDRLALVAHINFFHTGGGVGLNNLAIALVPPSTEKDFVSVYDGHLYQDGKRVRFWSNAGTHPTVPDLAPGDTADARAEKIAMVRAKNLHMVQRLKDMGFNMIRMWSAPVFDRRVGSEPYVKGDGSYQDTLDEFLSVLKDNGLKVWFASFGNTTGDVRPEDARIVNDPATAEDWKAAVAELKDKNIRGNYARHWDPRLEVLYIRDLKVNADRVNQYTGLRYGDDPLFAVWELTNEEWWMSRMVGGQWQKLPAFLRKELIEKWHGFLKTKYGDETALIKAWGFLMAGESLEQGTILLAPLREANKPVKLNDTNPLAEAAFKGIDQPVGRKDFTIARGNDVLEFLVGLQVGHKQRVYTEVKKWGKSCALAPVIFDTGIGYEAQAQYMHQQADAVAHCAYINGTTKDVTSRHYPFFSGLEQPPQICYDVPWLEHNKVEGKPFFCYETQIGQPAKYRAEFPWRLVALGTVQDWDIISWHYYNSNAADLSKPNPYDIPLSFPGSGEYQFHMVMDEVQMSAMRAASAVFRGLSLKPAPTPTRFIWGRTTLYDPASMDYAGSYGRSGLNMLPTTYRYGSRILIDPSREDDVVQGPVVTLGSLGAPSPIVPTDEITFDWNRGFLKCDAPGTAMFVGFLAQYGDKVVFTNGLTLSEVTIRNDAGIPYPVTDTEKYISFCVTSEDGQPLADTKKALISLVSTSFNTGLDVPAGRWGSLPVLYARVGGTVTAPALTGMRYTLRDWHMREIGKGVVKGGLLKIAAEKPVFVVELER